MLQCLHIVLINLGLSEKVNYLLFLVKKNSAIEKSKTDGKSIGS